MSKNKFLSWILLFVLITSTSTMNAQSSKNTNQTLEAKQQSIVAISALTAIGDIGHLRNALTTGLDAGLSINEIKEILVHLYAYCGFPRSLNGLNTFKAVLEERKARGITDIVGKEASPVKPTNDKYEEGRKVLETLTGTPQPKPARGYGEFSPRIDGFLKEHLFADIFQNDILSHQQRELISISVLSAMPGLEAQLQGHLSIGLNVGISESQLQQVFDIVETHVGKSQVALARQVLLKIKVTIKEK